MKNKHKNEPPVRDRVLKRGEKRTEETANHRASEKRNTDGVDELKQRTNFTRGYYSRNGGHSGYNGL
jgi:hypothetical protein